MATRPLSDLVQHLRGAVLPVRNVMTDGEILAAVIQRGDEAALATLVHRHGPMVWGVCRRVLADHHDAEDAFQATFLVLIRKAVTIRDRSKVAHWLHGVAHQTALKARAVAARRKSRERQVLEMPQPAVAQQDLWDDLRPILDQELSRLPEKYGTVIVLCDLEGKTRKEVAQQLGWPEGTTNSRLARARMMLAQRLARHGLPVSGGALTALMACNTARATVPPSLESLTIKAATLVAVGQAMPPGLVSAKVASLTEGVLKAMLVAKLKVWTLVVVVAAVLVVGSRLALGERALEASAPPTPVDGAAKQQPKADPPEPCPQDGGPKARATIPCGGGAIYSLSLSPDGKTLATLCAHQKVKLWDLTTGKKRADLDGTVVVVFSPNGKTLAWTGAAGTAGAGTVKLWDVAGAEERATLEAHIAGGCFAVAFSPDSTTLASVGFLDQTIKLWDVATGKEKKTLTSQAAQQLRCLAFSPNGRILAAAGAGTGVVADGPVAIQLWDVATGRERATLEGHRGNVCSLAFSPDGKTLASGGGYQGLAPKEHGDVKLWEVATGKERASFTGHTDEVNSVAFSPDGRTLVSGSLDNTLRLWDVPTGKERALLKGIDVGARVGAGPPDKMRWKRSYWAAGATFSPDGKMVAMGSSTSVMLWDMPADWKARPARSARLSAQELDQLWTNLAGTDAKQGYRAVNTLAAAPGQSLPFLKERVRPASAVVGAAKINQLIADLDSDQFAVRQKARDALAKLEEAEPALQKRLKEVPSLEVRRQIEQLLATIAKLPPESLRGIRAVEALEHIGTFEAKQVLETLAQGAEGFHLTNEARVSLARLKKKAPLAK
jgi:RNA polymerase sigma factor (sigma-70 family)